MVRKHFWLVAAVAFAACWGAVAEGAAAKVGEKAPAFSLLDQEGNKAGLSDFADKIVVLEWVNWDCPYSRRHQKPGTLKALLPKYKGKDVVFLGINTTHYHNVGINKERAKQYGIPYPILDDHSGDTGRAYGAKTSPDMRIIDKKGIIVYQGAIDNDPRGKRTEGKINYVEQALDELLGGQKISTPQTRPYGCSVKYARKRK